MAAHAGFSWRDYHLKPRDPGSGLYGGAASATLSVDGDWQPAAARPLGIRLKAEHVFKPGQSWLEARPFVDSPWGWKAGIVTGISRGSRYLHPSVGLFVADFEFTTPFTAQPLYFGSEAGIRLKARKDGPLPYAGMNVGWRF